MSPEDVFAQMLAEGDIVLDKLDACARTVPDKVFLHYGEDDVRLSFAEFKRRTDRLAAGLAAIGVTQGAPVSVLTRNSLVAAVAMVAIWRAGGIFAPINFNFRGMLLSYQLNDTRPFALITDPSFAEVLEEVVAEVPLERLIVHTPAAGDHDATDAAFGPAFARLAVHDLAALAATDAGPPAIVRGPFEPANIVYTSGTTGPSKGVLQPFRWINHYTFPFRQMTSADDVIYCDLPMYHVGGAFFLLARALWQGNTVGLWDKFSPSRFWDRIAECGATTCVLLDVMVPWLMSAEPRPDDRANTLNKVHMQPLPPNHHEVAQRFGLDFVTSGFGQTESGAGFAGVIDQFGMAEGTPAALWRGLSKVDFLARCRANGRLVVHGGGAVPKGFMGTPNPLFEAAVLDEDDNRLPPGHVGQLAFRPRFPGLLLLEYFGKPEATLKVLRTCWFHTGDAVQELDDGSGVYCFVDRMGGFFRVRGENVSSYEVEALVASHPKVRAAAAIPIPARVGSEEDIALFVELAEGEALGEDELRDHTRRVMPKYMQPAHVRFIPALPVTPTNKIEKYKLKRQIVEELGL
ncbi:AMP-binding protein [Chelatococcus reniformis]|uniref:ATP-dependent acyl-CoA ligase n=1 Tax=Chelatococcus reniformis TaxID=1494448 RepID=A0A916TYB2_9HYPH|nr:AMP-binding protein [Chelatococcus reniformis]GGC48321.1 ATP-dependent acyl-CoA ligase [Chelatococcus reniformis]